MIGICRITQAERSAVFPAFSVNNTPEWGSGALPNGVHIQGRTSSLAPTNSASGNQTRFACYSSITCGVSCPFAEGKGKGEIQANQNAPGAVAVGFYLRGKPFKQ